MMRFSKFIMFCLLVIFTVISFSNTIVATINPYYLITKEIVQDKMDVQLLIKPGSNPHTFSPTVSDVKMLSNATLIFANGLGIDNSYLKKYKNVVYLGDAIPRNLLLQGDEDEGEYNPHVWLSLDFLINYIVPKITQEVIKLDSKNKSFYEKNSNLVIASLKNISSKIDKLLSGSKGSVIILEHPSFLYFFNKYGIKVLSVEEGHGKQPSTQHIKNIINTARSSKLLGIFVGPQFDASTISTIAKELNTKHKILDPLGFTIKAQKISALFENVYLVLQESLQERK